MDRLKWETVTYTIAELKPAGGVVTQRDVLEKYKAEHPDDEVKTFSGFKYDYQSKTVSLRIAIADNTVDVNTTSKTFERVRGSIGGEIISSNEVYVKTKLLQPEYDELLIEVRTLRLKAAGREELSKKYDELENQLRCSNDVFLGSEKNYLKLKTKYDALKVENDRLISRLMENEELKIKLETAHAKLLKEYSYLDRLQGERVKEAMAQEIDLSPEDSADLVEAKKAIAEGGGISLDEVDMPEGELDDGTPDCCSDGTVPEDNENE